MVKIKDFADEPLDFGEIEQSEKYARFIKWVPKYADCICVTCNGLDIDGIKDSCFGFLYDSISDHEYTDETAVTETPGTDVLVLYLKIDHITMEWLREKKNIYDFKPVFSGKEYFCIEDLCFVKNGRLEMCSCTHERFCYISPEMLAAYGGARNTPRESPI